MTRSSNSFVPNSSQRTSRVSMGSNTSGSTSRRHSLLSPPIPSEESNLYDYSTASRDKFSHWRHAYVASENGDSDGVQSTSLALPDETRFTTCMAMSEDQPLLAVGSGSYETNMFFVQSLDDQLDVRASFASKFPIYSLAFKSNMLMAGTDRNTSVLYKVDRPRLLGYSTTAEEEDSGGPLVRCIGTFKGKSAKSVDIAAPGNYAPTKRVSCVSFAPSFSGSDVSSPSSSSSELFLSCLGGVINIWDASQNQHPQRIEKVSSQPLGQAAWSPQSPNSLIAVGGMDGIVSILDLRRRGKAIAWRTNAPDTGMAASGYGYGAWLSGRGESSGNVSAINDVAWSPFVPYWLATAEEIGQTTIWDLRYTSANGAAVTSIQHPTNHGSMRSVAWSSTHVDLISTGSSDRSWWLHSLRAEEDNSVRSSIVADRRAADDIGSVISTCAKGNTFYTLSTCGDLYAHRLTPNALSKAAVRRMEGESFQKAESAVYARDIKQAAESVLGLVERLKEESDLAASQLVSPTSPNGSKQHPVHKYSDSIKTVCGLFKAKTRLNAASWTLSPSPSSAAALSQSMVDSSGSAPPITPLSATTDTKTEDKSSAYNRFVEDLRAFGYGLPPGFPLESIATRQPAIWQALERLNMSDLRITLAEWVESSTGNDDKMDKSNAAVPVGPDGRPIWKSIVEREEQIVQYVKTEPGLFDPRLLRSLVKLILPHDCIAGLKLGLGICEAYLHRKSEDNDSTLMSCRLLDGLVHVLLFPTVFDTDSAGNQQHHQRDGTSARQIVLPEVQLVRERIGECLEACPEVVCEMVRLEIKIQETVLKGGEQAQVAETIVNTMKDHSQQVGEILYQQRSQIQIHPLYPTTTTLSASAVRLYLNSLVPMRAYDEYLVNSQWWRVASVNDQSESHVIGGDVGWQSSYPLARIINKQTATLVIPRLKRQLDVVRSTIQKEPLSLEPRLYRDTLLKIARISLLMRCEHPLSFSTIVSSGSGKEKKTAEQLVTTTIEGSVLLDAFDEIGNAFLMLLEALTRHTSHRDAHTRASKEAIPLFESLSTLLDSDTHDRREGGDSAALLLDEQSKHRVAAIKKFLRKLEHYSQE